MNVRFDLPPVIEEAFTKVASMIQPDASVERALLADCVVRLTAEDCGRVENALAFARRLDSKSASHPNLRAYFNHPLRVARMAVQQIVPTEADHVILGLLHNVYEVCGLSEDVLENAGYGSEIAVTVRLLTIDRERQNDRGYLAEFYGAIEAHGPRTASLKCFDKLDNLLGLEILEDPSLRKTYIDLSQEFVVPLAARLSAPLGVYLQECVDFARARGFVRATKDRWDQLTR